MKLHQDRETFRDLLSDVSRRTGIRSDIIEKDYYITLGVIGKAGFASGILQGWYRLQRFRYVKVEATSFTISEPVESLEISPLLYSEATQPQRQAVCHRND